MLIWAKALLPSKMTNDIVLINFLHIPNLYRFTKKRMGVTHVDDNISTGKACRQIGEMWLYYFRVFPIIFFRLSLNDSPIGISFSLMQTKSRFTEVIFEIPTMKDLCVRTKFISGNFSSIAFRLMRVRIGFEEVVRYILM